jgi:hypothetical protein
MKHRYPTYFFLIILLAGISLSCSDSNEQLPKIDTENSIWTGDQMLIHFNNGKVQYDTESGFNDFRFVSNNLIVQKSASLQDTLFIEALSDSTLRVITLSAEYFQDKDTLILSKYEMKDSINLVYFKANGCFGSCPIQSIEIENDTLKWVGTAFIEKTGHLFIPTKNIEYLLTTISKRLNISKIHDYEADHYPIVDNPTYNISFIHNGQKRDLEIGWDSTKELRYLLSYLDNIYTEL